MPDPRFADKSVEQLDEIMDNFAETGVVDVDIPEPVAEAAPVEVEAPVEEAAPAEPVEQYPPEEAPTEEEQLDYRALAEKLQADLEKQQKHASRLAGELGYLRSKGKSSAPDPASESDPAEDYGVTPETVLDRLQRLEEENEVMRRNDAAREEEMAVRDRERIAQIDTAAATRARQLFAAVDADVTQTVIAGHTDEIREIEQVYDPARRESLATELVHRMSSEAHVFMQNRAYDRAAAQKTASTAALHKAKIAQTPSGSGSIASPPPRPKGPGDMTAAEADRWLRDNVT